MLNLYIAPRSRKARIPEPAAVEAALAFLRDLGLISGETPDFGPIEFPPGREVARLFNNDAHGDLLPAELTFDCLNVEQSERAMFLPPNQPADAFHDAVCRTCGDELDLERLGEALDALAFLPTERFEYTCPSCRSVLKLADVDFGQPTAVARFWLFIEGAGTSRLNPAVVERVGRLLGMPVVVVPEVPEERVDDWVPARRLRRARR